MTHPEECFQQVLITSSANTPGRAPSSRTNGIGWTRKQEIKELWNGNRAGVEGVTERENKKGLLNICRSRSVRDLLSDDRSTGTILTFLEKTRAVESQGRYYIERMGLFLFLCCVSVEVVHQYSS